MVYLRNFICLSVCENCGKHTTGCNTAKFGLKELGMNRKSRFLLFVPKALTYKKNRNFHHSSFHLKRGGFRISHIFLTDVGGAYCGEGVVECEKRKSQ